MQIENKNRDTLILSFILLIAGIILCGTSIEGTFSIDEINYMISTLNLEKGSLTVQGLDDLPPSKELYYFDPEPHGRVALHGPVIWLVSPLYAVIALPFLSGGWYGLIFINIISFLTTTLLVFLIISQFSTKRITPWFGAGFFFFGSYAIEYAQGVWPHMLAVFFVITSIFFATRAWNSEFTWKIALSGLFAGVASGIREQNIFIAFCIGGTILLFSQKRWRSFVFFCIGIMVPLVAIAIINYLRFDYFILFPKAIHYVKQVEDGLVYNSLFSPFGIFWAKVVDFSNQPPISDLIHSAIYFKESETGAILVGSAVKKALFQSVPWMGLALFVMVLSWFTRENVQIQQKKIIQALSLLVIPTLFMFTLAGYGRMDGLAFNQRYFHELIPIAAIALAFSIDRLDVDRKKFSLGIICSALIFFFLYLYSAYHTRHYVILKYPLFLAALLPISWLLRNKFKLVPLLSIILGLCLGWSFTVHIGDDLAASRKIRENNAAKFKKLDAIIPDNAGLFAHWGAKDAAGILQLRKDVVILDTWADQGKDAAKLKAALQQQGKRIFVIEEGLPKEILETIADGDSLVEKSEKPYRIYEVIPKK